MGAFSSRCRRTTVVVWLFAAIGVMGAARLLWWYWPGSFFHNAASSTWVALAWDVAHGELYRPVLSTAGFGGTRYMPLLFLLHALLIRLHLDPIPAGVLLMQGSVVLVALALYVALRAANVRRAVALPFSLAPWASVTYQKFSTDLRVDYLAAALVVAAFAAATMARRDARWRWSWCAGAACVLAVFSKFTEIVFVVPVAIVLAGGAWRKRGAIFVGAVTAVCLVLIATLQWASSGQFVDNLHATFTAGAHVPDVWRRGVPTLLFQLAGDPMIGVPFALAVWSTWIAFRRGSWMWTDSYFAVAALTTCAIYASPGTSSNHMIEVQTATLAAIGVAVARGRLPERVVASTYGVLVLLMIALVLPLPWIPSPIRTLRRLGPHQRSTVDAIRADFLSPATPYLSLDPIVPVLLHDRPTVLDPFNLNLFVLENTDAGQAVSARIRARAFAAIIVDDDEGAFGGDLRPGDDGFADGAARFWAAAPPLVRLIGTDYAICAVRRPFVIFRPAERVARDNSATSEIVIAGPGRKAWSRRSDLNR